MMKWHRNPGLRRYVVAGLRWGIALVGLGYVLWQISLHDRVLLLDQATGRPVQAVLARPAGEADQHFLVVDRSEDRNRVVWRDQLLRRPDRRHVTVKGPAGQETTVRLLAIRSGAGEQVDRLLIEEPGTRRGVWVAPSDVVGGYRPEILYPLVEIGLVHMVRQARLMPLALALLIYPLAIILTSLRWKELLQALDIHLGFVRTVMLNVVGAFYNSFMPGSVGGDVFKAYYASRQTFRRTRAVVSVLVDRAIGMLALVLLGGVMAIYQYTTLLPHDPLAQACRWVAVASGVLVGFTVGGLVAFYHPALRRLLRLESVLARLPIRKQASNAVQAMEDYGRRPALILGMLLLSIPVHVVVVLSAMLAGKALGLPLSTPYYFVAVPVIVLSGILPLAPQGAGIMELMAILLTRQQGATVAEAFALTLAIRLVPVIWSMGGGFLVVAGGYQAGPVSRGQEESSGPPRSTRPATDPPL